VKKLGVLGYPVGHSVSPAFQQAALDACGVRARYERYEVAPEDLPAFIEGMRGEEWLGANVTIPHKRAVMRLLDSVPPYAAKIGAVNTIVRRDGVLEGHNTDAAGFVDALRDAGFPVADMGRVVVLGSGGAARGVLSGLLTADPRSVTVSSRSHERARALANAYGDERIGVTLLAAPWASDPLGQAVSRASLLVNATPIGMRGGGAEDVSPVSLDWLRPGLTVFDLVYSPIETPLLRAAREAGALAVGGLDMLARQGARSFGMWTGVQAPPIELMKAKAREAVEAVEA
jgi:shikimate dehydrogenase